MPEGTEEITPSGEATEAPEVDYKAEFEKARSQVDELTKVTRSQEKVISKHKGYDRSLTELRTEMSKKDRESQLEMARLRDAIRKGEITEEPESEYDKTRRRFDEEEKAPRGEPNLELEYFKRRLAEEGYELDDPAVQRALKKDPEDADDALKQIRSEKERHGKEEQERIDAAVKAGVQAALRDMGVTKDDAGPNAAVDDDKAFMHEFAEGNRQSPADFERAIKIQSNLT